MSLIYISITVGVLSITITKASIFGEIRNWVTKHSPWLGKLINCHYCLSHWLATLFVVLYQPLIINSNYWLFDYIITIFVVIAFAMPIAWVTYRSYAYLQPDIEENILLREALIQARKHILFLTNKD